MLVRCGVGWAWCWLGVVTRGVLCGEGGQAYHSGMYTAGGESKAGDNRAGKPHPTPPFLNTRRPPSLLATPPHLGCDQLARRPFCPPHPPSPHPPALPRAMCCRPAGRLPPLTLAALRHPFCPPSPLPHPPALPPSHPAVTQAPPSPHLGSAQLAEDALVHEQVLVDRLWRHAHRLDQALQRSRLLGARQLQQPGGKEGGGGSDQALLLRGMLHVNHTVHCIQRS